MFNRLKTFSEDVAKSINEIQQGDPIRKNAESINQLKNGAAILNTQTPDTQELAQPENELESQISTPVPENRANKDGEKTENGTSEREMTEKTPVATSGPLKDVDLDALPPLVRAKLKKFTKYEDKYPILLDAYKMEKRKGELIAAFEKVLRECTPISSISDAGVLVEYLRSVSEKATLLDSELRKSVGEVSQLTKEKTELLKRIGDIEKTLKYAEENLGKVAQLEEATKSESRVLEEKAGVLEKLLHESRQSVSQCKVKLEESEQKLRESEQKLEESDHELVTARENLERSKTGGDSEQLQKQLDTLKDELSSKTSQFEMSRSEKAALELKIKDLAAETATLKGVITASTSRIAELEAKILEKHDEMEKLQVKEVKLEPMSKSKKKRNKKAGKVAPVEVNAEIKAESNGVSEYSVLSQKFDDLLVERDQLATDLSAARRELELKTEDIENLKDLLRDIGDDLFEAKEQFKAAKNAPKDSKLQELEDGHQSLQREVESKQHEISELLQKLATTGEELGRLTKEAVQSNTMIGGLNVQLSKLKSELAGSKKELENFTLEKDKLNQRVAELTKFKSMDSSLKLEIASLQTSISHKDERIKEYKDLIEKKNRERDELNNTISTLRATNGELSSSNRTLISEKSDLINKHEMSFERTNSLNTELSKLQVSRQTVLTELDALKLKYDALIKTKANSSGEIQSFKQQYDELSMKAKESQMKIDDLEDELSETKGLLQERTRESATIRRLLIDAEEECSIKCSDLKIEIRSLNDEKVEIESTLQSAAKKRQREIDELKSITDNYLLKIQDLERSCEELKSKYEPLLKNKTTPEAVRNLEDLENTINELRSSLQASSKKVKDYENVNRILKKLSDESSLKFERLSKNYKHITQQYRQMQSQNSKMSPPSSRRASLAEAEETKPTNVAYLKNVLVGFFEHKEQREQLLPVVKMLFQLDDEDEKKLMGALK